MIQFPHSSLIQSDHGSLSKAELHSMERTKAAKEFEGLILQQLVKVLRSSVSKQGLFGGNTPGAETYMHMFDKAFAEQLVASGGIGMHGMFEKALGAEGDTRELREIRPLNTKDRFSGLNPSSIQKSRTTKSTLGSVSGKALSGAVGSVQKVAKQMLSKGQGESWAKEEKLSTTHLRSELSTSAAGGVAKFNVRDANGYQGYNKCNLFSLEMARRAGFQVPVVTRARGWGFPSSNQVALDAADKTLSNDWGKVVTGLDAQALDQALVNGKKAFLLVGSAPEGRSGHMAMVERVHQVDFDADGSLKRIVFDGWEARTKGASHLKKRTWNLEGNRGGHLARNGFNHIEIIELLDADSHRQEEVKLSKEANPSKFDNLFSSLAPDRPKNYLDHSQVELALSSRASNQKASPRNIARSMTNTSSLVSAGPVQSQTQLESAQKGEL